MKKLTTVKDLEKATLKTHKIFKMIEVIQREYRV